MNSRLMTKQNSPTTNGGNTHKYETIWYCLRLGAKDRFPDGHPVPAQKWKTLKPIWIRLGEGFSWAKAITFGPAKETMLEAAESFGAKGIVWLEPKNQTEVSENSQDTRSDKKRGVA